ncbi:hypothetical protein TW95_gp0735 [Pandoravirus inopinatum]|uniref:Uncharacterized protein n=1 Tax=Pandoravirus inopinatum TaxID=1605721 RepID=A0A0B5J1R0_9VIRU|nr:hypothetical protein TW95_gp0735 [Pandoravirus inopinatum]AJF97469.1 hypothetical protein [Pandoravirus inopinatum]
MQTTNRECFAVETKAPCGAFWSLAEMHKATEVPHNIILSRTSHEEKHCATVMMPADDQGTLDDLATGGETNAKGRFVGYELDVPLDIQYAIMERLAVDDPETALRLASTSTTQSGLLERAHAPVARHGLLTPVSADVSTLVLLRHRLALARRLAVVDPMPGRAQELAAVLCVIEAFVRFQAEDIFDLTMFVHVPVCGEPDLCMVKEARQARTRAVDDAIRTIRSSLPAGACVAAWYRWLAQWTCGAVDAALQATDMSVTLIDRVMTDHRLDSGPCRRMVEWWHAPATWSADLVQVDDQAATVTRPVAISSVAHTLLAAAITESALCERASQMGLPIASSVSEAALADPVRVASVLKAVVDDGVAALIDPAAVEVLQLGVIALPRLTNLFSGPLIVSWNNLPAAAALVDMRSPAIENLLMLAPCAPSPAGVVI